MFKSTITSRVCPVIVQVARRPVHSSPVAGGKVKEQAEKVARDVDKKLGKGMASAIEKGEELTEAAKHKLGAASEKVKSQADHATEVGKEKASEAGASARQTKEDIEKEVRK